MALVRVNSDRFSIIFCVFLRNLYVANIHKRKLIKPQVEVINVAVNVPAISSSKAAIFER